MFEKCGFCENKSSINVNFVKNYISEILILWNIRFWKWQFCLKWAFQNMNCVKIEPKMFYFAPLWFDVKSPKLNWKYVRQYSAALSAINSQGPKLVHLPPETCSSFIIKNTANHYQRQVGSEHKKFTSSTSTLHKYSCIFYNPFLVRYSAWIQLIEVELKNLIALEKQEKKTGACPISLLYGFCHILIVNPASRTTTNKRKL